jgi:hypothetical protein
MNDCKKCGGVLAVATKSMVCDLTGTVYTSNFGDCGNCPPKPDKRKNQFNSLGFNYSPSITTKK